jgi:hypothetical protein
LEGVEQPENYLAEKNCIRHFLTDESQGLVSDLKEALDGLKPKIYNPGLNKLDASKNQYRQGRLSVLEYASFLAGQARGQGIVLTAYPVMAAYLAKHREEFSLDIDCDQLLAELDVLDQKIRFLQYTDERQQQLDTYSQRLEIIERLLAISASPEELALFRQHPEDFRLTPLLHFITAHAPTSSQPDLEVLDLEKSLDSVLRFYEIADRRSADFVNNLLAKMQTRGLKIAILTTGGYHTDQILNALQKQGIGFISIKPRLSRSDVINPYFNLIKNRRSPLEKLLAQNQQKFALAPFFMQWINTQAVLKEADLPEEIRIIYQSLQLLLMFLWLKGQFDQGAISQDQLQQAHAHLQANYPAYDQAMALNMNAVFFGKQGLMVPLPVKGEPVAVIAPEGRQVPQGAFYNITLPGFQLALYHQNKKNGIQQALQSAPVSFIKVFRDAAFKNTVLLLSAALFNLRHPEKIFQTAWHTVGRQGQILWLAAARALARENLTLLPVVTAGLIFALLLGSHQTLGQILIRTLLPSALAGFGGYLFQRIHGNFVLTFNPKTQRYAPVPVNAWHKAEVLLVYTGMAALVLLGIAVGASGLLGISVLGLGAAVGAMAGLASAYLAQLLLWDFFLTRRFPGLEPHRFRPVLQCLCLCLSREILRFYPAQAV